MDLQALKAELELDPEAIGYTNDADLDLARITAVNRSVDRDQVPTNEIIDVVVGDLAGLTATQRQVLGIILSQESVNIRVPSTWAAIGGMFSGGTLAALQALQTQTISRAAELGLGNVRRRHITEARAL